MTRVIGLVTLVALTIGCTTAGTKGPGAADTPPRSAAGPASVAAGAPTELVVGLYPYVPRLEQFETAITAAWRAAEPDIALRFLPADAWDGGYDKDPPAEADIYVFDAMFFAYFRSQDWLEPMAPGEIDDLSDFLPYAIQGVEVDGRYFGIPQLGCGNILFYLASDTVLAEATTLSELDSALGQCTYTSEVPPDRRGLMIDMSGGTTNASLYLDAVNAVTGAYPPPLPWDVRQIDPQAMGNVRLLLAMASYANGTTSLAAPYQRETWWSDGWGRAVVGYTEAMSAMTAATRASLDFKVMPLSDNDRSTLFYADVIGVNTSTVSRGTRDLAVRLANVIAASVTMIASIGPDVSNPYPQYLMATRPSIFQALGERFPIYAEMYDLVTSANALMFVIDDQAREWLAAMKATLRTAARADYRCGCDYVAVRFIPDNAQAASICNQTCGDHSGWSGAWTNQPPAAPVGDAVCGCNGCPVPGSLPTAQRASPEG